MVEGKVLSIVFCIHDEVLAWPLLILISVLHENEYSEYIYILQIKLKS